MDGELMRQVCIAMLLVAALPAVAAAVAPILSYGLDEGSGTVASDSSGNGYTGTLTNGPTWEAGQLGQAVHFDGANDFIAITTFSVKGLSQYSIAAWVKSDAFASEQAIYSERLPASAFFRAHFAVNSATNIVLQGRAQDSDAFLSFVSCTLGMGLMAGAWNHLVAVFDSVADVHSLYVNGSLCASNALPVSAVSNTSPGASPKIGARFDGAAAFLTGSVDDFRVYGVALSAQDVLNLYSLGSGGIPPSGGATNPMLSFAPSPPTAKAMNLAWDPVTTYTDGSALANASYLIERREPPAVAFQEQIRNVLPSAWQDTAVIVGTQYCYRAYARDGAGAQSLPSNEACGVAVAP